MLAFEQETNNIIVEITLFLLFLKGKTLKPHHFKYTNHIGKEAGENYGRYIY